MERPTGPLSRAVDDLRPDPDWGRELAAECGRELDVTAEGDDEQEAMETVAV